MVRLYLHISPQQRCAKVCGYMAPSLAWPRCTCHTDFLHAIFEASEMESCQKPKGVQESMRPMWEAESSQENAGRVASTGCSCSGQRLCGCPCHLSAGQEGDKRSLASALDKGNYQCAGRLSRGTSMREVTDMSLREVLRRMMGYNIVCVLVLLVTSAAFPGMPLADFLSQLRQYLPFHVSSIVGSRPCQPMSMQPRLSPTL